MKEIEIYISVYELVDENKKGDKLKANIEFKINETEIANRSISVENVIKNMCSVYENSFVCAESYVGKKDFGYNIIIK